MWTDKGAPRIWRIPSTEIDVDERGVGVCTDSGFGGVGDETLFAADRYTDSRLARLAEEGFTGVWLFAKMHELMVSRVFPELNSDLAEKRLASLQALVQRARKHGVGVHLYFNDPVGVSIDHPFWDSREGLKGVTKWDKYSLCTSTAEVKSFFEDALDSIFERLRGIDSVFLITACEDITHCWSKSPTRFGAAGTTCPRCAQREPADIVIELLQIWANVRNRQAQPFRVVAWNWEWSYWYADPQSEIVKRLPAGVELLLDMEIGGTRRVDGREEYIGEYSLGYVGPSERFVATQNAVAGTGTPIHAKIQIDNTHELATVPNIPVLSTLHAKFAALSRHAVAGFLGCWSIGCRYTLNTAAMHLFLQDPSGYADSDKFLRALADSYFGDVDAGSVLAAWSLFSEAFLRYPFSVQLLYYGAHNDAPALPLSMHYRGEAKGCSYSSAERGDNYANCFTTSHADFALLDVENAIEGFAATSALWDEGVSSYEAALGAAVLGAAAQDACTGLQEAHRKDELRVAQMIGHQLRSTLAVYRFYRETLKLIAENNLTVPCALPATPALVELMKEEIANCEAALPLLDADARFGFHEECRTYKYDGAMVRTKLSAMRKELAL